MPDPTLVRVPVRPLDAATFARFGSVIEAGRPGDETLNRAPGQMAVHVGPPAADVPEDAVHRDLPLLLPRRPLRLRPEPSGQHRRARPDRAKPSVIWFLPDKDGKPDLGEAQAILLDGRRGIVLNPGVWIRYAYPLLDTADFAYVSARVDPEDDIERVVPGTGRRARARVVLRRTARGGREAHSRWRGAQAAGSRGSRAGLGVGGVIQREPGR